MNNESQERSPQSPSLAWDEHPLATYTKRQQKNIMERCCIHLKRLSAEPIKTNEEFAMELAKNDQRIASLSKQLLRERGRRSKAEQRLAQIQVLIQRAHDLTTPSDD